MEGEALKKYINSVFELEKQLETYFSIKSTYTEQIKALEAVPTARDVKMEVLPEWRSTREYKDISNRYKGKKLNPGMIITLIIMLIELAIAIAICAISETLTCFLIIPTGFVLYSTYMWGSDYFGDGLFLENPKKNEEIQAYFLRCHQEQLNREAERNKPYVETLYKQQTEVTYDTEKRAKRLLNFLYSFNIVPEQYRSFFAIAMFCQYLDTGRCSTLDGSDGALALYIKEQRTAIIAVDSNSFYSQVSSWNNTMPYAVNAVNECTKLQNAVLDSINNRSTEPCEALLKYIDTCAQINDGIAREYDY